MFLRNYSVVLPNGSVVKKGSTVQTLRARFNGAGYKTEKYKGCHLRLDREQEWPDSDRDFGILLLRVREQIDISKSRLWVDEGGWNVGSPVKQWLIGAEDFAEARIAAVRQGTLRRNHDTYHAGSFEMCSICHATSEDKRLRRKQRQAIVDRNRKDIHNERARQKYAADEAYRKAYIAKRFKINHAKLMAKSLLAGRTLEVRRTYLVRCIHENGHSFYNNRCSRPGCGFIRSEIG